MDRQLIHHDAELTGILRGAFGAARGNHSGRRRRK
jgi:hypothetical protein